MNVVFIIADDLGWMDISPNNPDTFYDTPNLQKLAKSAERFTNGYAACPVCSPTRSSILTGQYPARTRNTDYFGAPNEYLGQELPPGASTGGEKFGRFSKRPVWPAPYLGQLAERHVTLAEAFKEAGYATFFAGKWHLGPEGSWPTDHGFDINMGGTRGGGPYTGKKYFSPYDNPNLEDGPEGEHLPDRLAAETEKFITANKDGKFLAYLSFYSVHTPLMGRPDLVKKYQEKRAKMGLEDKFGQEPPRKVREIQAHAIYAAMVEAMDQAVGRVLDTLDREGLTDSTMVVFFSDNGGLSTSEGSPTSNLPLRAGKGWLYEGGVREPLLVRLPGVTKPGTTCAQPVTSTDFYPTLLEACGLPLKPKQHVDGHSFLPALKDPSAVEQRPIFWHYPHWGNQGGTPGSAVRLGPWKLIRWAWGKDPELFNLEKDPGEHTNLAASEPEQLKKLNGLLDGFLEDTKALPPQKNPGFKGKFEKW